MLSALTQRPPFTAISKEHTFTIQSVLTFSHQKTMMQWNEIFSYYYYSISFFILRMHAYIYCLFFKTKALQFWNNELRCHRKNIQFSCKCLSSLGIHQKKDNCNMPGISRAVWQSTQTPLMSQKNLRKCRSTRWKLYEKNGVVSLNISVMRWNQLDSMLSESSQGTQNVSLKAVSDTCPRQDDSKEGNNRCEHNRVTLTQ